jgi:hypothetical protein
MTTTASALNQISLQANRGGAKAAWLLLVPVVLAVVVVASMLFSVHESGGAFGIWGVVWFTALGVLALGAGALRDMAFGAFDAVRESQDVASR